MTGRVTHLERPTVSAVLAQLRRLARPDQLEGMARYGMSREGRLGISIPTLRRIAKQAGKDHRLALDLWKSGIVEAPLVASMVDEPERGAAGQMEPWVRHLKPWDV